MTDFNKGDVVRVTRTGMHPFKVNEMVTILDGPNAVDIYRVRGSQQETVMHRSDLHKPAAEAD
jgi:hypothetical protein